MTHFEVIKRLESYVSKSEYFSNLLSEITILQVGVVVDFIKSGLMDEHKVQEIGRIAPTCYKIGNKVFLRGETKGTFDFIGDGFGEYIVTELFDMTTEMLNGDSNSIYVTDCSYFELASISETEDVSKFLNSLSH